MVAGVLAARQYLLKRQIRRITAHLNLFACNETAEILHIELLDSDLEVLADTINENIVSMSAMRRRIIRQDESIGESITNIGHDLRTPLTSVMGNLSFALQETDPEAQKKYLLSATNKSRLMKDLLTEYHELSVFESPGYHPELSALDMNKAVRQFLADTFDQFSERSIEPVLQLPNQAVMIQGNQLAIERILLNLFSNSLKYSDGEIGVQLDESCVMTIWNSFSGEKSIEVDKLFDRFYQSDFSRKDSSTGLGLYIVKMLAEKQGASVEALYEDYKLSIKISWLKAPA